VTDLRSDEVSGVARRHEQSVLSPQLLGKPKVTDPQRLRRTGLVSVEDVGWFEISVHHLDTA